MKATFQTIYSGHIEEPEAEFFVRVDREAVVNVLYTPPRTEIYRVMAQTPEGAVEISRYHFSRGTNHAVLAGRDQAEAEKAKLRPVERIAPVFDGGEFVVWIPAPTA